MSTKSYIFCPVSVKRTQEKAARLSGLFTAGLILVFAFTGNILPIVFLFADFFLRACELSQYSPIAITSKGIIRQLGLNSYLINAGPKIFAARIGFVLCFLVLLSTLFHLNLAAWTLAGILGLFSFLEGAFGLCIACEIYPFVHRFLYRENS